MNLQYKHVLFDILYGTLRLESVNAMCILLLASFLENLHNKWNDRQPTMHWNYSFILVEIKINGSI